MTRIYENRAEREKRICRECAERGLTINEFPNSVEVIGRGVRILATELQRINVSDLDPWHKRPLQV